MDIHCQTPFNIYIYGRTGIAPSPNLVAHLEFSGDGFEWREERGERPSWWRRLIWRASLKRLRLGKHLDWHVRVSHLSGEWNGWSAVPCPYDDTSFQMTGVFHAESHYWLPPVKVR